MNIDEIAAANPQVDVSKVEEGRRARAKLQDERRTRRSFAFPFHRKRAEVVEDQGRVTRLPKSQKVTY
jgi:hypothetical protein